jgi:hypothetical protein
MYATGNESINGGFENTSDEEEGIDRRGQETER